MHIDMCMYIYIYIYMYMLQYIYICICYNIYIYIYIYIMCLFIFTSNLAHLYLPIAIYLATVLYLQPFNLLDLASSYLYKCPYVPT